MEDRGRGKIEGDLWRPVLFITPTYKKGYRRRGISTIQNRRYQADSANVWGDVDALVDRLSKRTRAHFRGTLGAIGGMAMHGHAFLYSPDLYPHRRARALLEIESGIWGNGTVKALEYDPQYHPHQPIQYIRDKHDNNEWLDLFVYCPEQCSSCRKGRCRHKVSA